MRGFMTRQEMMAELIEAQNEIDQIDILTITAFMNDQQVAEHLSRYKLCESCGHPANAHEDKYGCQVERGDQWVTGNQASQPTVLMAMGPCGCNNYL